MRPRSAVLYIPCLILLLGCETFPDGETGPGELSDPIEELIAAGDVSGSLNPWPLVDDPEYTPAFQVDFLPEDELVLVTKACGIVQVFPHSSMFVEVVNQEAHGVTMAVTFCPITKSGIAWNRVLRNDTLLLTASGYLYRDNLMPLDLNSNSIWMQMSMQGISGPHENLVVDTYPLIEMPWKTVKKHFPQAAVFIPSANPGSRKAAVSMGPYVHPGYAAGQELGIIHWLGIGDKQYVELFTRKMFQDEVSLLRTSVHQEGGVVVAGSSVHQYMTAFYTRYEMNPVEGEFPVIMMDETGTRWNIFGEAVYGERGGERLNAPYQYTAAAWAWNDIFDRVSYHKTE